MYIGLISVRASRVVALSVFGFAYGVGAFAADAPWLSRFNGPANLEDVGSLVAMDSQGNTVVAGTTSTELAGGPDFLIVKFDSTGALLWQRRIDVGRGWDVPHGLAVDASGNIVVTGESQIAVNGTYGFLTVKFDPQGGELWRRRLQEPNEIANLASGVAIDSRGNVVVTGSSTLTGVNYDYLTVKYDPLGNELWRRRYDSPAGLNDAAVAVGVDASDNIYVAGNSQGRNDVNVATRTTGDDFVALKYSPAGQLLWDRRAEAYTFGSIEQVRGLAVDPAGGVAVVGSTFNTSAIEPTYEDIYVVKFDPDGQLAWSSLRNGTGNFTYDYGLDIAGDASGNFYVTGRVEDRNESGDRETKFITSKFNSDGQLAWERTHLPTGADLGSGEAIAVDASGNVFVGGFVDVLGVYPSKFDYMTLKYSNDGVLLWTQRYNGPAGGTDEIADIAVDGRGGVVVTGRSFGGFDTFMDIATLRYVNGEPFPDPSTEPPPPPLPERPAVDNFVVTQGIGSGGPSELTSSDNRYLTLTRGSGRRDALVQLVLEGTTRHATPSIIQSKMELATTASVGIEHVVEYFNFATGAYERISRGGVHRSDVTIAVAPFPADNLRRFVQPETGKLRVRMTFSQGVRVRTAPWQVRIDQFDWYVAP